MIDINASSEPDLAGVAEYVTVSLAGQQFGIPIASVYDILNEQRITPVALASREVAGVMNIRGRIVTAIDARQRLAGGAAGTGAKTTMNVVVHHKGEPYALVVDTVGEVRAVDMATFEKNPPNMNPSWAELCRGVHRLDGGLLIVLDVEQLVGGVSAQQH
jgi:purine-binding chemotaxis protein CheW